MGRELKRVALNFVWPIWERWDGYVNPFYVHRSNCLACDGTGYSAEAKLYSDQWYGNAPFDPVEYGSKPLAIDCPALRESIEKKISWGDELVRSGRQQTNWFTQDGIIPFGEAVDIEVRRMFGHWSQQWSHQLCQADVDALVEAGRLYELTRTFVPGEGWKPKDPPVCLTADEVNAWAMNGFCHDDINQWVCIKARCKREGVAEICETCCGDGESWESEELKKQYDDWQKSEPPSGEGYQIWETVSEGSPVSPVFATPEELADWMVLNDDSVTKDTTRDQWLSFIHGPGWAPSLIQDAKGIRAGTHVTR